jgi:UDP-N-acetylglucosamine 2-epimerase (non-hydrolysing)
MKVLHVAGARPNFMKVAPVLRALKSRDADTLLVHTGQHYDRNMSQAFFEELGLPDPDTYLEVGSATHAVQTAWVMERFEPVLEREKPDLVVVVGDVNSTLATAITSAKLLVPVAHVEAGLRSFDRTMPEEINRVLTDQISELLFTTSPEAEGNLVREGIEPGRIHFVGNPMIDSLERHRSHAEASDVLDRFGVEPGGYALVTLHRPSNVDNPETLRRILDALRDVAHAVPVLFPAHPRTLKMVRSHGLDDLVDLDTGRPARGRVALVEPVPYFDFLRLITDARVVLTDSGGIQEETTVLGVPCLTLRRNTERPITVEMGTNRLVGPDPDAITNAALEVLGGPRPQTQRPPLWDGNAGERIADVIVEWGGSPLTSG